MKHDDILIYLCYQPKFRPPTKALNRKEGGEWIGGINLKRLDSLGKDDASDPFTNGLEARM